MSSSLAWSPNAVVAGPAVVQSANLYEIDPLADVRWPELVQRHPRGCLFHSAAWLRALNQTYGYKPVAFTTSAPSQPLRDGFLFCEVKSWITGCRLVSLPFSDYCDFLCDESKTVAFCADRLMNFLGERGWRYVEFRPVAFADQVTGLAQACATYTFHHVDLRPAIGEIFERFHQSSIQRKIRRAERESLGYEEGSSDLLLDQFYRLLVVTRRRHRVPPQPKTWFRNLVANFGGDLKIRIAFHRGRAVAGIVTIRYKDSMYYKYGGSDAEFNNLGGMHYLYWHAIQDSKRLQLRTFDLGRSDLDQPGLITFKSRWGSQISSLTYYRITGSEKATHCFEPGTAWRKHLAGTIFARTPAPILAAVGSGLYKHIG
jgi:hypothetical protein